MTNLNILPTLSILSACNNHCPYCFQKNNNTSDSVILDFNETVNIISWLKQEYDSIVIMGGEPLLHPDIVHIMNYISKEMFASKIITNLVTEDTYKIINLSKLTNISWLINTTTDKSNKELFDLNLHILLKTAEFKKSDFRIFAFSLTLTGNINLDSFYIDNLINILKKIPKMHRRVRITPNMPNPNNIYKFYNYDSQYNYLLDKLEKASLRIALSFDCGVNHCFISQKTIDRLKKSTCFLGHLKKCPAPYIDITADKKILACHYLSEEFFEPIYYYNFSRPAEYTKLYKEKINKFISENPYTCKAVIPQKDICKSICPGTCPALSSKIIKDDFITDKKILKI